MNGQTLLIWLALAAGVIAISAVVAFFRKPRDLRGDWEGIRYHDHMIDTTPTWRRGRWL